MPLKNKFRGHMYMFIQEMQTLKNELEKINTQGKEMCNQMQDQLN